MFGILVKVSKEKEDADWLLWAVQAAVLYHSPQIFQWKVRAWELDCLGENTASRDDREPFTNRSPWGEVESCGMARCYWRLHYNRLRLTQPRLLLTCTCNRQNIGPMLQCILYITGAESRGGGSVLSRPETIIM